jgi:uncharacterized protein (TIGR03435 family)
MAAANRSIWSASAAIRMKWIGGRRMSILPLALLLLATFGLVGQTVEQSLTFEIVSVKPTSGDLPDGRVVVGMLPAVGGPGTDDPGRIRYPAISLKVLLLKAFDVRDSAGIQGPDWLDDDFFELNAIMPRDTTDEQFRAMLRNLLSERFGLAVHLVTKPASGYVLTVAKNGPSMKESAPGDMPPLDEKWVPKVGKDGFIAARSGQHLFVEAGRLRTRYTFQYAPMKLLVGMLEMALGQPVTDKTGLTKNYDAALTFRTAGTTGESGPGLGHGAWATKTQPTDAAIIEATPNIFEAVRALGLRLDAKKIPEETVVIDHIEKLPSVN